MALEAVIFDMDGLLINSEPFWQIAEIEIFGALGIEMSHETSAETIGMRLDKVVEYRYRQQPWTGQTIEEVTYGIMNRVIELIHERGEAMPGVYELLEFIATQSVEVGLATSSHPELLEAVMKHLDIGHYFAVKCSATHEVNGKPHPAVFLTAAEKLGVNPYKCLVLEDSFRGLLAAKSAEMLCIYVPDPSLRDDPKIVLADKVLDSLTEFDATLWAELNNKV